MKRTAGRTMLAGLSILALTLAISSGALRITHPSLVVNTIRLNEAGWDLVLDIQHHRVFAFDATSSPSLGPYGQPILKALDTSTGRVVRTLPLAQSLYSPLLSGLTGHLLAVARHGRAHPFSVVVVSTTTGTTMHLTDLPVPPLLPADWLARTYSVNGAGEPGSVAVNERAGYLLAATRQMYQLNGRYYPDDGLFVLGLSSGSLLRTIRLPGMPIDIALDPVSQSAFVADGTKGKLLLVNPVTGSLPRTLLSHGVVGVVFDPATHRALAVDSVGLRLFDTWSGHLLATVPGPFGLPLPVIARGGAGACCFICRGNARPHARVRDVTLVRCSKWPSVMGEQTPGLSRVYRGGRPTQPGLRCDVHAACSVSLRDQHRFHEGWDRAEHHRRACSAVLNGRGWSKRPPVYRDTGRPFRGNS